MFSSKSSSENKVFYAYKVVTDQRINTYYYEQSKDGFTLVKITIFTFLIYYTEILNIDDESVLCGVLKFYLLSS